MDAILSTTLRDLRAEVETLAVEHIAPHAEQVDKEAMWPRHAFDALAKAGLMGLNVPTRLGGRGLGLLGLAVASEALARACSSSAMCFAMHCVGTAVIAAKATADQEARYLRPIAAGRHVTSLSLSETGTGVHFYLPQTRLTRMGERYIVNGEKQFITNGGHADSYVVSTIASTPAEAGDFSCVVVDRDAQGLEWLPPWQGFGMRGNSSRGLKLSEASVPAANLLGEEGDQVWYVFEVVTPYFLIAMAASYLGAAQAAFDLASAQVRNRRYTHSGEAVADVSLVQHRLADLWIDLEKTRGLIYHAAYLGDSGDPRALLSLLASKADVAEVATRVVNEAMTLAGGQGYRENAALARLLRDVRAAHVMSPTTPILKQWLGRALLGMPLL